MKQILLFVGTMFIACFAFSQNTNQADQGQRLAQKIAKQMKDSLDLNGNQMNQLVAINLSIHNQKKQAMASGLSRDSIGKTLQKIENTRDSLYRTVIPAEKFEAYKTKKRRLVNNN